MSKCIVYQQADLPVSIVVPINCGLTIEQIGEKDVPAGVPFWIVDAGSIPADRTFRDSWDIDNKAAGTPSGTGGAK